MEENIYEFLGLTPKDGEAKVRAELDAQIKKWNNQMTRQPARAKAKLAVLKKFKADLDANPNMLKEHADKYASVIARKRQEQEKIIREEGAFYVVNGEIEENALAELARKNTTYTKDEILAIIGAKVKQKKEFKYKETGRGKDMAPTLFKRVCEELAKAKKRDLYDFLGVPRSAPASLIEKIANEKYAENQSKPVSDEKVTINSLIGYCKTLLLKEDARADYDYTCDNPFFAEVKDKIERVATGSDRIIRPEQYKILLEICIRNGISSEKAEYMIHKTAQANRVTIIGPADDSYTQKCRFCGSLNTKGTEVCKTCGLPVVVVCPKCGRESSDQEELICPKCGFAIGDIPKVNALINDAQIALKSDNLDEASRCIETAATIWPTHPMLSELQILIHNRTQEHDVPTKKDGTDQEEKKYDVFISYSRKDIIIADRICDAFDKAGISYFIDRKGISGGLEFPDAIAEAILNSNIVLFLASNNSYKSKFTNAELTFAFNEKPKNSVLPYIIDGSLMPASLRLVFSSINWRTVESHPIETVLTDDVLNLLAINRQESFTETRKSAEKRWSVGDYYNVDGKEGLVFWVDETGQHGKIVSLDQALLKWSTEDYDKRWGWIAMDCQDGMKNQRSIKRLRDWRDTYPAFAWCAYHGDGWYLPAIDELKVLLQDDRVRALNAKVSNLKSRRDKHSINIGWYWSSTECDQRNAWIVLMFDGSAIGSQRSDTYYVRAVSTF